MNREYDLFEIFPDGSALWRDAVTGRDEAMKQLRQLSTETPNEIRLMHLPSQTLVAAMNTPAENKGADSKANQG